MKAAQQPRETIAVRPDQLGVGRRDDLEGAAIRPKRDKVAEGKRRFIPNEERLAPRISTSTLFSVSQRHTGPGGSAESVAPNCAGEGMAAMASKPAGPSRQRVIGPIQGWRARRAGSAPERNRSGPADRTPAPPPCRWRAAPASRQIDGGVIRLNGIFRHHPRLNAPRKHACGAGDTQAPG